MSQNGKTAMSGQELRQIRKRLGYSLDGFAIELGYEGTPRGNNTTMRRFESGERPISMPVAKLAWMIAQFGVPTWPQNLTAEPAREDHP